MQIFLRSAEVLLPVRDACQLDGESRIARGFPRACLERQFRLVPFFQASEGQPAQKIQLGRLIRAALRKLYHVIPAPGIEGALRGSKTGLIRI